VQNKPFAMFNSEWIVFYFAIVFDCLPVMLESLYETLPVKTHVFAIGKRIANISTRAGLTKTICYAGIKYRRKYRLRRGGRIILTYNVKFSISHIEGQDTPGGSLYADFTINGEGLLFDLNTFEKGCSIFHYDHSGEPQTIEQNVRITDWWRRLCKQFYHMNAEHITLLAMSPKELRERIQ
jgi:hypothetical protein